MSVSRQLMLAVLTACAATAWGQDGREPHIGYLYPGGGQRGSTVLVTVGGQLLRGANTVHVSGEGVHAEVIEYYRPIRNIRKEQRQDLQRRLKEVRDKRLAELPEEDRPPMPDGRNVGRRRGDNPGAQKSANAPKAATRPKSTEPAPFRPVEHPLLYDLENKSLRELQHIVYAFSIPREKRQLNMQIAESVLIEVTVEPDAAPGDRELRLQTALGLTNPMVFQVGQFPEVRELEPNDPNAFAKLPRDAPLDLPVLINGQIMPGDVDRFRFRAKQGQGVVIEAKARHLVPYLADAVPGWFQATVAVYDGGGNEVAFADDYRFDPDPVLFYAIPADGVYELEIRDSIYRGREDFVYRVAVSEQPFITQAFPLGGRAGAKTVAKISGWNLTETRLRLDTGPGDDGIRQTALLEDEGYSNAILYAVGKLPESEEHESNDSVQDAQKIDLPRIVNGRIGRPGDVDVFRFKGRAGDGVVAEVYARRLHSPLDSVLRLSDSSGRVLEWNDDCVHKDGYLYTDSGLLTHHADSYLYAQLPEDGVYYVHLGDSQHQGGDAYAYRLRIGPPQPDFELCVTPSSMNVPAGRAAPLCVYALRKDGFDGDIEVVLKDAPPGFALDGGRIPAGRNRIRMTLTAPPERLDAPVVLRLEGRAHVGEQTISRQAVPTEDMMQAFLYRHLAPSRELMVSVRGPKGRGGPVELVGDGPVRLLAGGTARVRVKTPRKPALEDIQLELNEAPEGITLHDITLLPNGLAFTLEADGEVAPAGLADNLIVEAFTKSTVGRQGGKGAQRQGRVSLGVLPAIPFEIVQE